MKHRHQTRFSGAAVWKEPFHPQRRMWLAAERPTKRDQRCTVYRSPAVSVIQPDQQVVGLAPAACISAPDASLRQVEFGQAKLNETGSTDWKTGFQTSSLARIPYSQSSIDSHPSVFYSLNLSTCNCSSITCIRTFESWLSEFFSCIFFVSVLSGRLLALETHRSCGFDNQVVHFFTIRGEGEGRGEASKTVICLWKQIHWLGDRN